MLDQTSQQPHLAALPPVSSVCAESPSLQRCWTLSYPNLQVLRSPLCHSQNQTAAHPIRRRCLPDMPKQKTIAELNAEKEKIEQQLTQEQHKKQRLENRIAYYERGDRTKRAHNLIVRSADMESIAPLTKLLTRAEFYTFAEKVFDLPEVKGLLMEAVNEHNRAEQKEGC